MSGELEGLESIADGLFVKSVSELLTVAHERIRAQEIRVATEKKLVAPPIPGPPLAGAWRHLFKRAIDRTASMRPLKMIG